MHWHHEPWTEIFGVHWVTRRVILGSKLTQPEDATRIAYRELVYWLEKEYGIPRYEAYMLLSQCGIVRLGNVVDPKYSVGAGIKKTLLEKLLA